MNIAELLGLLRGAILNDRTDRVDGTSDYLWEDETLITYINEAQRRFAVRSLVLRDGTTPEVTEVELEAGVSTYVLHSSIVAVITAKMADNEADLNRVGHSLLNAYRPTTDTWIDPAYYTGLPPGAVLAISTDEEVSADAAGSLARVTMRVYPTPSATMDGKTIKLRVVRKPLHQFTVDDLEEDTPPTPEIPEDHHLEMLDWAAYLALRIEDDDAGSAKRAQDFASAFEDHVREARALVMRKLFTPQQWGFGRGGFAWSND